MFDFINSITPLAGLIILICIGGGAWAVKQIINLLNETYVKKTECNECITIAKNSVLDDSERKYNDVLKQIKEIKDENFKAYKELKEIIVNNEKTLVRIETKFDIVHGVNDNK